MLLSISVTEMTVVVISPKVGVQLVLVNESLFAELTEWVATMRRVVGITLASVSGQVRAVVQATLSSENLKTPDVEARARMLRSNIHDYLEVLYAEGAEEELMLSLDVTA